MERSAALRRYQVGSILLFVLVIFFHLWRLDTVPKGLYADETSIGLNAHFVAQTGRDEHGTLFPVYFRAFGEYKNPLYIYTAAAIFRLAGTSEFTLRLTSFIFFLVFLAGYLLWVRTLFPDNRPVFLFAMISGGFIPWYFCLSRIAFETISQPAVWIWALYAVYRAYEETSPSNRSRYFYAGLAGGLFALSLYAYSTGRLLCFLMVFSLWLFFHQKIHRGLHLTVLSFFCLFSIPYGLFIRAHPDALISRFRMISYWYNPLPLWQKLRLFMEHYLAYWQADYLVWRGDVNLRHSTGHGELFYVTLILSVFFACRYFFDRKKGDPFLPWLFFGLLCAPIGGALTSDWHPHSLRSALMGVYFLILSCYGFKALLTLNKFRWGPVIISLAWLGLCTNAAYFIGEYFLKYPARSVSHFDGYNFREALSRAMKERPAKIVFDRSIDYTRQNFYKIALKADTSVAFEQAELPCSSTAGTCLVYLRSNQSLLGSGGKEINIGVESLYCVRCY